MPLASAVMPIRSGFAAPCAQTRLCCHGPANSETAEAAPAAPNKLRRETVFLDIDILPETGGLVPTSCLIESQN
jgi:hypothetical protein